MKSNELKGGKADNMSIEDIAKKHDVSVSSIENEIKIGVTIEKEHTDSEEKQLEIVLDHLFEDPEYYSNKKTGLIAKEKESEKRLEKQDEKVMNEIAKKMKSLAGIQEGEKSFLKNMDIDRVENTNLNEADQKQFLIIEFEQEDVESGEDDEKLYKIK